MIVSCSEDDWLLCTRVQSSSRW